MSTLADRPTQRALMAMLVLQHLILPQRPVEAAPPSPVQLELRDDSGRLQLDAARHRVLAAYSCGEAGGAVEQSDALLISVGLTL